MKSGFLKVKTLVIAGAILAVSSVGSFAATNDLSWNSNSSHLTETKDFPTESTVKSTVGFTPKYVDSFDGGFKFDTFNFSNESLKNDDTQEEILNLKSAEFDYKRENSVKGQILSMSAEQIDQKYFDEDETVAKGNVTDYKGTKIYYSKSMYKSVPEDYVQTEEDKKQEAEGILSFGYGADEVSVSNTQFVIWYEDGIEYSILNMNYDDLSQEDMIKMAKKVIDK